MNRNSEKGFEGILIGYCGNIWRFSLSSFYAHNQTNKQQPGFSKIDFELGRKIRRKFSRLNFRVSHYLRDSSHEACLSNVYTVLHKECQSICNYFVCGTIQ